MHAGYLFAFYKLKLSNGSTLIYFCLDILIEWNGDFKLEILTFALYYLFQITAIIVYTTLSNAHVIKEMKFCSLNVTEFNIYI